MAIFIPQQLLHSLEVFHITPENKNIVQPSFFSGRYESAYWRSKLLEPNTYWDPIPPWLVWETTIFSIKRLSSSRGKSPFFVMVVDFQGWCIYPDSKRGSDVSWVVFSGISECLSISIGYCGPLTSTWVIVDPLNQFFLFTTICIPPLFLTNMFGMRFCFPISFLQKKTLDPWETLQFLHRFWGVKLPARLEIWRWTSKRGGDWKLLRLGVFQRRVSDWWLGKTEENTPDNLLGGSGVVRVRG